MVIHIAIFEWKRGTSKESIDTALQEVRELRDKIPGVVAIYCGENFSKWAKEYSHAIVVLAENQEALDRYRAHPGHEAVAKSIEEIEEDGVGVDFIS